MIPALRYMAKKILSEITGRWPDFSRLLLVPDRGRWVIDREIRELSTIAHHLGIRTANPFWVGHSHKQAVFYGSQFFLLLDDWLSLPHRIGTAYFHGKPGVGIAEFDALYDRLRRNHEKIARIQVSHAEMRDCILGSGIAPDKVFLIPIGIDISFFQKQTSETKKCARQKYGIPATATVIGSFLKDGVGWEEGLEPKLIKGPDIFLKTIGRLKSSVPELFILLSGPARGYVKKGLERLGVPYRHVLVKHYPQIADLYQALDLCLVSSRQEGGPKAVLEAMASGVPLVTTRVGQAMDMVRHGENGFMVHVEDVEGLAHWCQWVADHPSDTAKILVNGRLMAEENTYEKQSSLWRNFMNGFVEMGD